MIQQSDEAIHHMHQRACRVHNHDPCAAQGQYSLGVREALAWVRGSPEPPLDVDTEPNTTGEPHDSAIR